MHFSVHETKRNFRHVIKSARNLISRWKETEEKKDCSLFVDFVCIIRIMSAEPIAIIDQIIIHSIEFISSKNKSILGRSNRKARLQIIRIIHFPLLSAVSRSICDSKLSFHFRGPKDNRSGDWREYSSLHFRARHLHTSLEQHRRRQR